MGTSSDLLKRMRGIARVDGWGEVDDQREELIVLVQGSGQSGPAATGDWCGVLAGGPVGPGSGERGGMG